jgi:hypothetical protein
MDAQKILLGSRWSWGQKDLEVTVVAASDDFVTWRLDECAEHVTTKEKFLKGALPAQIKINPWRTI